MKESERYFNKHSFKKDVNENQSYLFNKICRYFFSKILLIIQAVLFALKKIFLNYSLRGFYGDYF